MRKFDFHYDAGHGWLKVHIYEACDVGLVPEDFTSYSYKRGEHLFLEEDLDAGRFIAAWERCRGQWDVRNIDDGHKSAIRSYERITPTRQFDDNDILF